MKLTSLFRKITSQSPYFVIVMDLCSSSVILEKLQMHGDIKIWRKMWKKIFNHMIKTPYFSQRCVPYKFVGDGFIILFRSMYADSLLSFMQRLDTMACSHLDAILNEYHITPKRHGFCYGIDGGKLITMNLLGKTEYMGEAINAATRLQSQLKNPKDAESIMVSESVYEKITIPPDIKQMERNCVLRNLYDDQEIRCHQLWLEKK